MTKSHPSSLRPIDEVVLRQPLACRDCGYDLRGLPLGGACPECATPVWQTVLKTIDPATSRLPRLRNPRAVGNGLLLVACCLLVTPLLLGLGPALRGVSGLLSRPGPSPELVDRFGLAASAVAWLGVLAAQWLSPRHDDHLAIGARRRLLLIAMGFAVTATAVLVLVLGGWYRIRLSGSPWLPSDAMSLSILAALILGGLLMVALSFGGVLRTVGDRSREYRTNLTARQRTGDLAVAIAVVMAAELVRVTMSALGYATVAHLATTLAIAAFSMALIGFAYLALNCFWIRRSLRRPPPTILELLIESPAAVPASASASAPPEPDHAGEQ